MYHVGEFMSREVVTLKADDTLATAASYLRLGRIRHLPVLKDGKLLGLVTHRDVVRALGTRGGLAARNVAVRDVMRAKVVTVTEKLPLRRAAQLMLRNKLGCLPVLSKDKRLVGIIAEADLVRFAATLLEDLDKIDALAVRLPRRK